MLTHHVIYVPGLADHKFPAQRYAPRWWQVFGVRGHYVPMIWNDKQSFEPKLQRLLDKIDELSADGSPVSLVGSSAGASVVLVALAERSDKVAGAVCICGKINHPETVWPERFAENPAFQDSLAELQRVLPKLGSEARARIMSIHPLRDSSVPPPDTIIPGAREKVIPVVGHGFSIFFALAFFAPSMMHFLRRASKQIE